MKKIIYLLCILTVLTTCKKDKLEGDKAIFIGKWNWIYSTHTYSFCDGDPNTTVIIDPETDGNNYSMEFLEKGIVKFYENGNYLDKDRIIFTIFNKTDQYYDFAIDLNNDNSIDGTFNGRISVDSLVLIHGFPYQIDPYGCESYISYFVKE